MLKWLTAAGATGLDTIKVHATPDGGVGVASGDAGVAPGEEIASIPATCVMSVGRSAASAARGERATHFPTIHRCPSRVTVLWLDMASGRRDESHAPHPTAALPKEAPDVASWTTEELALLAGTGRRRGRDGFQRGLAAEHARGSRRCWVRLTRFRRDARCRRGCSPVSPLPAATPGRQGTVDGSA